MTQSTISTINVHDISCIEEIEENVNQCEASKNDVDKSMPKFFTALIQNIIFFMKTIQEKTKYFLNYLSTKDVFKYLNDSIYDTGNHEIFKISFHLHILLV